jgi:hypothetical protein
MAFDFGRCFIQRDEPTDLGMPQLI